MEEAKFRAYLAKLTSTKTGNRFGDRVISNILSRCSTTERKFGIDLDTLPLPPSVSRRDGPRIIDATIPIEITGDYRSAVRKYLAFRAFGKKSS